MNILTKSAAYEVSQALFDATQECVKTDKAQSVVYVSEVDAAVAMPAEPDPEGYGWKVITTVIPDD